MHVVDSKRVSLRYWGRQCYCDLISLNDGRKFIRYGKPEIDTPRRLRIAMGLGLRDSSPGWSASTECFPAIPYEGMAEDIVAEVEQTAQLYYLCQLNDPKHVRCRKCDPEHYKRLEEQEEDIRLFGLEPGIKTTADEVVKTMRWPVLEVGFQQELPYWTQLEHVAIYDDEPVLAIDLKEFSGHFRKQVFTAELTPENPLLWDGGNVVKVTIYEDRRTWESQKTKAEASVC